MASSRVHEPTEAEEIAWREWVQSRPDAVRTAAERFDPWSLYTLKSTGQRVLLRSIFEDGTVSVVVSERFNGPLIMERKVFGIDPDDLEPCEWPLPGANGGEAQ